MERQNLAGRFHEIRRLRNRIAHHESIWRGSVRTGMGGRESNPKHQDSKIIETIGWISPETARLAREFSRVPAVFDAGWYPYLTRLRELARHEGWNMASFDLGS